MLAAGPDGNLFVAAGVTVVAVDPANGSVIRRNCVNSGVANSVAVSPDGSTLYVGIGSFKVVIFDVAGGTWSVSSGLQRRSGREPGRDLGRALGHDRRRDERVDLVRPERRPVPRRPGRPGRGRRLASVPVYSGGVIWVGGGQTLVCANPSTGQVLATATLPTDHGVLEYFSSAAVIGGRRYAYYQDDASQRAGMVQMTPPAACSASQLVHRPGRTRPGPATGA